MAAQQPLIRDPSDRLWEDLLLFIEEEKVVPVIGPELLTVRDGDIERPLCEVLARRLALASGLPQDELPERPGLNDVVSLHLRHGGERDDLYARLLQQLRELQPQPSPALRALARIRPLRLFVSLTFDSLLADALRLERPGSEPQAIAYSTNVLRDLPLPYDEMRDPVVFHLLGRASSTPEYVICDEDLLEFLHALQDGQRRPVRLFDALRANHLLILGCGFGDWLTRFFLRIARGVELTQKRKRWEVLADARAGQDEALTVFLSCFSSDTKLLPQNASEFIAELVRRWEAAHPDTADALDAAPVSAPGPRDGAIFISYASEDRPAAARLAEGLRAARLEVWFDQRALQAADDWALAIQRGIRNSALFLPVISRASLDESNRRREFWREWNVANELARGMAPDEPFIVPVVIDDTRLDRVPLPDLFPRRQGVALPGGEPTPEIATRLRDIVRDFHRRRRVIA